MSLSNVNIREIFYKQVAKEENFWDEFRRRGKASRQDAVVRIMRKLATWNHHQFREYTPVVRNLSGKEDRRISVSSDL